MPNVFIPTTRWRGSGSKSAVEGVVADTVEGGIACDGVAAAWITKNIDDAGRSEIKLICAKAGANAACRAGAKSPKGSARGGAVGVDATASGAAIAALVAVAWASDVVGAGDFIAVSTIVAGI